MADLVGGRLARNSRIARTRRHSERSGLVAEAGQASVELVAGVFVLVLAGLVCLQLLVAGYSVTVADGAVEAGALALAAGEPAEDAARDALPGWARGRAEVDVDGGRVTVRVRPPAVIAPVARALEARSSAWVRRPGGGA